MMQTNGGDNGGLTLFRGLSNGVQRGDRTFRKNFVLSVGTMALTGLSSEFHSSWERIPSAGVEYMMVVESKELLVGETDL